MDSPLLTPELRNPRPGEFHAASGSPNFGLEPRKDSVRAGSGRSGGTSKNQQHTLNELALFAGAGGGILGGKLLGWRTVCAVEINDYARRVLAARQDDGCLEPFPIWDDVRTFDGRPWRGIVDVVSGGFPCQDISPAGRRAGIAGERSGLWSEFARIIGEIRPRFAFIENSSDLAIRGLHRVLADLAEMGMDARWGVFSACSTGAPHVRSRMFVVAYPKGRRSGQRWWVERQKAGAKTRNLHWTLPESDIDRKVNGVAYLVDRLAAAGNGQVPAVAALAFRVLAGGGGAERQEEETREQSGAKTPNAEVSREPGSKTL